MTEHGRESRGRLSQGSPRDRVTRLAGVLAELSVTSLTLRCGCSGFDLAARSTDLPAQLLDATADGDEVTLEAPTIGAWFEITETHILWGSCDPQAAAYLSKNLVDTEGERRPGAEA